MCILDLSSGKTVVQSMGSFGQQSHMTCTASAASPTTSIKASATPAVAGMLAQICAVPATAAAAAVHSSGSGQQQGSSAFASVASPPTLTGTPAHCYSLLHPSALVGDTHV